MSRLACPLGDESIKVDDKVIEFLKKHYYIDVFQNEKYLFTLRRLEKK